MSGRVCVCLVVVIERKSVAAVVTVANLTDSIRINDAIYTDSRRPFVLVVAVVFLFLLPPSAQASLRGPLGRRASRSLIRAPQLESGPATL